MLVNMMGEHQEQKNLFSYGVDLDRRVRPEHPLRRIKQQIDFDWIRAQVAGSYGRNGNVSVDPVIVMKLMFLLFYDDVRSERELMRIVPERLDYLWFLGLTLDDEVPDHSVLSKARARWGADVFERLFVHTIEQCVKAGLVEGKKLHMDGSLITADASIESVVTSSPELIKALREAYGVQERKLEGNLGDPNYRPLRETTLSKTDPEAPMVRHSKMGGAGDSRPRYKHHRAVDDQCGVITAIETTPGDVAEPKCTTTLLEQHEANTGHVATTVVADQQYGTNANYRDLQQRGIKTHMGRLFGAGHRNNKGIFGPERFTYDATTDVYTCPNAQTLHPRRHSPHRRATEYATRKGVCAACPIHDQCTRAKNGRTLTRNDEQELIDVAHTQANSSEARRDRARRRHIGEGSFADAKRHHFKRSRWRRLWRQKIQDWLIAAIQNIKILLNARPNPRMGGSGASPASHLTQITSLQRRFNELLNILKQLLEPLELSCFAHQNAPAPQS